MQCHDRRVGIAVGVYSWTCPSEGSVNDHREPVGVTVRSGLANRSGRVEHDEPTASFRNTGTARRWYEPPSRDGRTRRCDHTSLPTDQKKPNDVLGIGYETRRHSRGVSVRAVRWRDDGAEARYESLSTMPKSADIHGRLADFSSLATTVTRRDDERNEKKKQHHRSCTRNIVCFVGGEIRDSEVQKRTEQVCRCLSPHHIHRLDRVWADVHVGPSAVVAPGRKNKATFGEHTGMTVGTNRTRSPKDTAGSVTTPTVMINRDTTIWLRRNVAWRSSWKCLVSRRRYSAVSRRSWCQRYPIRRFLARQLVTYNKDHSSLVKTHTSVA